MGMFDMIENELYCPFCGKRQASNQFQTKDFHNGLNSLDILNIKGVLYNIYHQCSDCNNWIDLTISSWNPIHTTEEGNKQIEKRKEERRCLLTKSSEKVQK